ncbi:MAG TPA: hypothetical protein VGM73_11310 [Candidatus Didemnitutus sp.]|jgi:hypothetical protein
MSDHPTSPAATGDRGGSFEQLVDVCYLSYLVTQGTPPFMRGGSLEEVHLQAEHQGWATDDLVLVGTVAGHKRKVAMQAKSALTLTSENKECLQVFADAWKDFNNPRIFDPKHDGIVLVCGPLPVATYRRWRIMLDAAQAALDAADWLRRLALPSYLGQGAAEAMATLRALLDAANAAPVTDSQLWEFAKVFDFQWLDLLETGSATEAAVRSLLAITATAGALSPADAAARSWGDLLAIVLAKGPTIAASYDYAKLPADLRQRHDKAPSITAATRAAVAAHSVIVERGVRTTIGGKLALARTDLVATVQAAWEEHRILCVSGPAGSGKSGVAKVVFDRMKPQGLAVAFRAESFGVPHLNDVFAPHGFTTEQLQALVALHPRKWIWVESVERLLEKSERHAFLDLLRLAAEDPGIRLILTCRDYQVEAVRSATFGAEGLDFVHVAVPGLTDAELAEAARQMPALAAPLGVPRLRELFRNLFILEKAAGLDWAAGGSLPQNEREFRAKVWREVIRRDDRPAGGTPQKRATTFIEIAMRRAQKLEAFVEAGDLDPDVLRQLKDDGLTVSPPNDEAWVATAHDVLEDWALLEWLTQQWRRHETDIPGFLAQIGTFPALRRAYRRWLTEWFDADPAAADRFVLGVLASSAAAHWRDDTLAATLLSSTAAGFITRNEATLVANNLALLRQCIHLVRMACKTSQPWLQDRAATSVVPLMPEGSAWGAIVDLAYKHLSSFGAADHPLLAGLLADWSLSVTFAQPYPAGADSAAQMAHRLMPADEDYGFRSDELNQVLAAVMLKVPKPVEKELHERVRASAEDDRWDRHRPGLAGHLLNHHKAAAVARDYPGLVIESFEAYMGLNPPEEPAKHSYRRREVVEAFGLPARLEFEDHAKSAYSGPFLNLLTYHPAKGLDLIIRMMNFCADAYGGPDHHIEFVEKPVPITLQLSDGTEVEQWANSRLWLMYRGTSVAPSVLCSALMALEEWLFRLAESNPSELEGILLDLIRRSNNVAVTAVVASVAMAHPNTAGTAAVALFTCPPFFHLDRARFVSDGSNHDKILGEAFPPQDAEHAIFALERNQSHEKTHRRENLESLSVWLQLGPQRAAVHKLLDDYQAELPPAAEQDDEVKLWRLLLHRIDLRNFAVAQTLPDGRKLIQSTAPASDVQAVVEQHRPQMERTNQRLGLWLWATQCWEKKVDGSSDPKDWPARLVEAQQMASEQGEGRIEERLEDSAVPQVAAICIRDHWDELTPEQRDWCVACVCHSAAEGGDNHDRVGNMMRGTLDLNRVAAEVLAVLLNKALPAPQRTQVLGSLAMALTHPEDRLRTLTAHAVGRHLWETDPALVWSCVGALVHEAGLLKAARQRESEIPFTERPPWEQSGQAAAAVARTLITKSQPVDRDQLLGFPLGDGSAHTLMPSIMGLLVQALPTDPLAIAFFEHVATTLARAWRDEMENGRRNSQSKFDDDAEGLDYEKEVMLSGHLAQFLLDLAATEALRVAAPVLDAALVHAKLGAGFLGRLISAQDRRKPTPAFWALWQALVDRVFAAIAKKSSQPLPRALPDLLEQIFLGVDWKRDARDWPPLAGEAHRVETVFTRFAPHPSVIEHYVGFLRRIGFSRLLPAALVPLGGRVATKPAAELLTPYSVKALEEILGRFIYSDPSKLKATPEMRAAVLVLLNACIEMGSSVCYRQRDDFLTPSVAK